MSGHRDDRAVGEGHIEGAVARVVGDVGEGPGLVEDRVERRIRGHARLDLSHDLEIGDPVQGMGPRFAFLRLIAGVGEEVRHGRVRVGQGQVFPQQVLPHDGLAPAGRDDLVIDPAHIIRVLAEIEGATVDRQDVDAVDHLGIC